MKGVDAVIKILQREGTEYLFAYPANPLIDAAARASLRPVIARTEKTLLNMVDGYSRATNFRKPAVCVVQQGPGIENAFGGIAQAYADRIPMLLIPGGPNQRRHGGQAEFDPHPPYHDVTSWTARINFADRVPEIMRSAFSLLRQGSCGPVLVELPGDVGSGDLDDKLVDAYKPARGYRSAADAADVAEAVKLLLGARRPVIQAGHGVLWAEATAELRELAELTGVPVTTTMAAKSAFPEDHALSLGTGSRTATGQAVRFVAECDVILGIGAGFAKSTFAMALPSGKTLIQVTSDARSIDRDYPVDLALVGDAKLVLRQLIDEVKRQNGKSRSLENEIKSAREAYLAEWMPRLASDESPINPFRVIWELNRVVDKANTIVTHDSGNPRDQILTFYEATTPRGYLGWGKSTQLGTGYGVAMGAKLAFPDKLCINVMGDLAFGTAGMEVETAVRERIPIMTIILNNSVMGGYGHHMPSASEKFGSNQLTGDYAGVAKALGAYAEKVQGASDVAAAIQRGAAATRDGKPVVLEFITKEEPVYPVAADQFSALARQPQAV